MTTTYWEIEYDAFTEADILDLHFIVSDLIDIPFTEDELTEQACYDTAAERAAAGINTIQAPNGSRYAVRNGKAVPIGKAVF